MFHFYPIDFRPEPPKKSNKDNLLHNLILSCTVLNAPSTNQNPSSHLISHMIQNEIHQGCNKQVYRISTKTRSDHIVLIKRNEQPKPDYLFHLRSV